jgi:two-component system LytT family response regulator
MITAIIVDDEPKNVSTLQRFLEDYCPQVEVVGTAENSMAAKELIAFKKPQLVFLDVEMPYGNGFDLLKSLSAIDFEIIFITAFDHYALNAFRFAAIDYLLKPLNINELKEAVGRAEQRLKEKTSVENYLLLLKNLSEQDINKQQIILTDNKGQHAISLNEILYCIADGSYTDFHLTESKVFTSTKNLKEFEDELPKELFCRIHHGHIINISHIKEVRKGRGGSVIMRDNKELEIAVRRKDEFLKVYQK